MDGGTIVYVRFFMSIFFNRQSDLDSAIKSSIKQTFPSVVPSELTLNVTEKALRGGEIHYTVKVPGSRRERFVWGSSRMGSSRLVG